MTAAARVDGIEKPGTTVAQQERGLPVARPASSEIASDAATELLRIAVERGTPVEQLEKLLELHERMEQRAAIKQFSAAMAAFQAECPSIKKSSTAKIVTKGGTSFGYTYAELDEIARTVNPILAKHGLSYGWDSSIEKSTLTCVCTVRHAAGHSEKSTFTLPTESSSAMSEQQKVGAALTFAKRQSLSSVLGITTTDEDTDTAEADPTKITEDQITLLRDLAIEVKADAGRFLRFLGVSAFSEIRASDYARAVVALEQKRGAR